jgi:hypothetical protein
MSMMVKPRDVEFMPLSHIKKKKVVTSALKSSVELADCF